MSNRNPILSLFVVATVALAGCASDTDEPAEEQGSTESAQKATPSMSCCAICWNRARGVNVGSYAGVKASGLTCNEMAASFCDEPGKGRGGLYDAQWGHTCGQ